MYGLALGLFLYFCGPEGYAAKTNLIFVKNYVISLGMFYPIFIVMVVIGSSNGVNLTDGLDGLAIGLIGVAALAYAALAYAAGHAVISEYVNIIFLRQGGEVTVYCAAILGASLGFLWFNAHPAEVFMGDTGSLSLGGAIGLVAMLVKKEILLLLVGGVFVAETLSVIIQVLSYKMFKKRVFLMSPLHHHFELKGWPEPRVIVRFWIVTVILVLVGLATLKVR